MSKANNYLFKGLYIIAWLIFVGLGIETGGIIVNFIFSVYKPEFVPNLYQKLDLSEVYKYSRGAFYTMYSFIISISVLKTVMFYVVVMLMSKIDLSKPFSSFVSRKIAHISYYTLAIGFISFVARQCAESLPHSAVVTDNLNPFWEDSDGFILMAAVIYIIAIIFKKGVDIQNENELTV